MKKLLFILTFFISVNSFAQVKVGANGNIIATGIYPVANSSDIKGSLHFFQTLVQRNALPVNFRDTGMLAYVGDSAKFFYLNNGILNSNWTVWSGSGSGGSSGIDSTSKSTDGDTTFLNLYKQGVLLYSYYWQGDGTGGGGGGVANIKTTQDITKIISGDTVVIGRLIPNGLILPGIVTWSGTGLIMDVANPQYYFNQKLFSLTSTQITLATADPTYPRFDVIYVDSSGNVGQITGVASATPIIPQIDPQSQLLLSSIYLAANATTPTQINQTIIYDENTEWGTSYTGTGVVNFNDASNPYHGAKDIKVTSSSNGMSLVFTDSGIDTASIQDVFKFFLYTPSVLLRGYKIQFFLGTHAVSTAVLLNTTEYGFSLSNVGTYQNISLPFGAFTFSSPYYNIVKITTLGANANIVYLDYVSIQHGAFNYEPTDYSNKVDSTTISGGNSYWWSKGISHLAGSVGGGSYHLPYNGISTNYLGGDTAYHALPTIPFQSLTTIGSSGAATLSGGILNVPNYVGSGGTITAVTASAPLASSGGTSPNITADTTGVAGFATKHDLTQVTDSASIHTVSLDSGDSLLIFTKPNGHVDTISFALLQYWKKNLNNIYYNGGNVGIGIIAPPSILTVSSPITSTIPNDTLSFLLSNPLPTTGGGQVHSAPGVIFKTHFWNSTHDDSSFVRLYPYNYGTGLVINASGSNIITFNTAGAGGVVVSTPTSIAGTLSVSQGSSFSGVLNSSTQSVGSATTVDTSAILDVVSTKQGFMYPKLTKAQRDSMCFAISSVTIVNGGTAYTSPPNVFITGNQTIPGTTQAILTSVLTSTSVSSILINKKGRFSGTPTLGFTGGGGSGAAAYVTMTQVLDNGLTIYCTDCTATDSSTGVMQTWNGTSWKNAW